MSEQLPERERQKEFIRELTAHQASLRAYIISLMPGQAGALDVLQEVNLTLWDKWKTYEIGTNFTAWAFAVARYGVMEHRRKLRKDRHLIFDDDLVQKMSPSPEDLTPESVELRQQALAKCLSKLGPKDKELVERRYHHKESLEGYANELGRSANSVRVALFRIRAGLRKCIEREINLIKRTA